MDRAFLRAPDDPNLRSQCAVALELAGSKSDAAKEFDALAAKSLTPMDWNNLCWQKAVANVANRFAGQLLMPPTKLRRMMTAREPSLVEIVSLAEEFGVSKEAMARGFVEASRHMLAVIVTRHARFERVYRQPDVFPWIEPGRGAQVPFDSIAADNPPAAKAISEIAECDPDVWLPEYAARSVEALTEQVMSQAQGYAMVLLNADLGE